MCDIISGIYKITNCVNGKVYIGKSIDILNRRWVYHKSLLNKGTHINKHLQNSWNKYGENNFDFSIILECTPDELDEYEIYYIDLYKSYLPEYGYNKTLGGDGAIPTEETRKKMSIAHKGILGTPESKLKQSIKLRGENNPMYGRKRELSPVYGKPKSDETIQKLKNYWTDERRLEQSKLISGENNPMSGRIGKTNPASRSAICIETGDFFETLKDAAAWCGLKTHTNISNVCRGLRKHAGTHPITGEKLSWKYAD
jgi:group I intron endonuclease